MISGNAYANRGSKHFHGNTNVIAVTPTAQVMGKHIRILLGVGTYAIEDGTANHIGVNILFTIKESMKVLFKYGLRI